MTFQPLNKVRSHRSRPLRAATATIIESLETRTLFAYALSTTIETPAVTDPFFGEIIMATQGDLALVGQPGHNGGEGQALLFNTNTGALVQTFANPSTSSESYNDTFGYGVAFVGDNHIAISAPDEGGGEAAVHIYDFNSTTYDYGRAIPRPATHDAFSGGFGRTMTAFDGDSLLVAEPFATTVAGSSYRDGLVEMYNVTTGALESSFTSPTSTFDQLGNAMAANGLHAAFSSITTTTDLSVVVVEYSGAGGPTPLRTITLPSVVQPSAVSIAYGQNGQVIVGDAHSDVVYVFPSIADDPNNNPAPLLTISGEADTLFGIDVVVRAGELLVTAPSAASGQGNVSAYVFDYTEGTPVSPATQSLSDAEAIADPSPATFGFGLTAGASANGFVLADAKPNGGTGALYVFENAPAPSLTADAGPDQSAVTQQPVTFIGSANPSADATFAWDLDNDGAFDDAFTAQADTTFAAAGTYTVRLQVTRGGATAVDEAIVNVTNTATDGDTLILGGTTGADGFVITQNSQGTNVSVNGVAVPFAGNRIVVYGGAGNDMIAVAPNVTAIIEAYGGDGDDRISGGASADILVAGNGDDVVIGFGGRDLLIGGNGADIILGMAADDILVAGFTLHDNDSATLRQISAIWNGSGTYTDRVDTLRAGLFNPDTSVFDDGAVDILAGNSGTDWFIFNNDPAARDRILDRNSSEISTDVDDFVPAE